jgi:hypothetical protein
LLVLGLRSQLGHAEFDPFADLRRLRLRARRVDDAILDGLRIAGRHGTRSQSERHAILEQEERLLGELQALGREIEESANHGIPREAWRDVRQRLLQLRTHLRELRRRYPGLDQP